MTFDGLRADVVGALGADVSMTPNLDRFLESADLKGLAIAASPAPASSLATALTGLPVWRHRAWDGAGAPITEDATLVAETLESAGYTTRLFRTSPWLEATSGLARGFTDVRTVHSTRSVVRALSTGSSATATSTFSLVDLGEPVAPFERSRASYEALQLLRGSEPQASALPERLTLRELQRDPEQETSSGAGPTNRARVAWVLYCGEVLQADRRFGAIVAALEDNDGVGDTSVVVMSTRGQILPPSVRSPAIGELARSVLEVPFGVRLAASRRASEGRFAEEAGGEETYVSIGSLAATILELADLERPPGLLPSVFEHGSDEERGALTERYSPEGQADYSWLAPDAQLLASEQLLVPRDRAPRRLRPDGRTSVGRQLEDALRLLEMAGGSELDVQGALALDGTALDRSTARGLVDQLEAAMLASGRRVVGRLSAE